MRRNLMLVAVAVVVCALGVHLWAQPPWGQAQGNAAARFQGYWMGVDPVDGGDARRSLLRQQDGTYALAARDTFFTLCDGTDRAFASFSDGTVVGAGVMQSNTLTIQCLNINVSVVLRVRYELIDNGVMAEVTTRQDGSPISTIIFHRVGA